MEVLNQSKPKARKEHRCNWCYGIIKKGEQYNNSKNVHDGEMYTWKNHFKCMEIANALKMFDDCPDGLTESDFFEFVNDEFGKYVDDERYQDRDYSAEEMVDYLLTKIKAETDQG